MAEVIKRLRKDKLAPEEYKFVSDLPLYEAYYQFELEKVTDNAKKAVKKVEKKLLVVEQQKLQAEQQTAQAKEQAAQAKEQTVQVEQQLQVEHKKLLNGIENLLLQGETIESIAKLLVSSVEEITDLVAQIDAKKS